MIAYLAGKREALADVLEFLQTGLDANGSNNSLNVERFINYICVRTPSLPPPIDVSTVDLVLTQRIYHRRGKRR